MCHFCGKEKKTIDLFLNCIYFVKMETEINLCITTICVTYVMIYLPMFLYYYPVQQILNVLQSSIKFQQLDFSYCSDQSCEHFRPESKKLTKYVKLLLHFVNETTFVMSNFVLSINVGL